MPFVIRRKDNKHYKSAGKTGGYTCHTLDDRVRLYRTAGIARNGVPTVRNPAWVSGSGASYYIPDLDNYEILEVKISLA